MSKSLKKLAADGDTPVVKPLTRREVTRANNKLVLNLRGRIKDMKRQEQVKKNHDEKKCDWSSPDDASFYRNEQRKKSRCRLILRICPDLKCPRCRKFEPDFSKWVVTKKKEVGCRSCHHTTKRILIESKDLFIQDSLLNCKFMRELRESIGISCGKFAALCGWTRSFQRKLERDYPTVHQRQKEKILEVLKSLGVNRK